MTGLLPAPAFGEMGTGSLRAGGFSGMLYRLAGEGAGDALLGVIGNGRVDFLGEEDAGLVGDV